MDTMMPGRNNKHTGMTMKQMVHSHEGTASPSPSSNLPTVLDPAESQRNYAITARLNAKNFMGNAITRVVLPKDVPQGTGHEDAGEDIVKAQAARASEQWRQIGMDWFDTFMPDPGSAGRLNNTAMDVMVNQKQLAPANTYGQFYAFMHALSAAFGNVQGS